MEKKRNQVARSATGQQNFDYFSKKDVSNKQQAGHRRHRKDNLQTDTKQTNNSNKNRSNFNYNENKGKANARKYNNEANDGNDVDVLDDTIFETSGLVNIVNENYSVFKQGSKKQNLNHLLNFQKYSREHNNGNDFGRTSSATHRYNGKRYHYNKEQYLQANCQFVVKNDRNYDYRPFITSPDVLVDWRQIVKVFLLSNTESQCPICLYYPKAAKITRCGHVFCFSCMLHYLSLSDKLWRKCPVCCEATYLSDLKSTTTRHVHNSYKVGDLISLQLMKRDKGSLFVNKACEVKPISKFPSYSEELSNQTCSKLIMANNIEFLDILRQEMRELEEQLKENCDCPESIFIQQAIELLKTTQSDVEIELVACEESDEEKAFSHSIDFSLNLNQSSVDDSSLAPSDDILINDENTLTIDDIIINQTTSNSNHFYYQTKNAQNIFLHSLNCRMLQAMYGSLSSSPQNISGKIVQIESCTMNEDLRKRLKYLQHLPVATVFEVVEIQFDYGVISEEIQNNFKDEIHQRNKVRMRREREEKKREKVISEIHDRQLGKFRSSFANIDLGSSQQFPESLTSPTTSTAATDVSIKANGSASFAKMLRAKKNEYQWPELLNQSTSNSGGTSFFKDERHSIAKKAQQPADDHLEEDEVEYDENECKAPEKNNYSLSDALDNALKSAVFKESKTAKGSSGSKKKAKKTLLFSSHMNFN